MARIDIAALDGSGQFEAYVACPRVTPAGAVVLAHEVYGPNASMRRTADEFAALGYFALVPDLFWRAEPRVELSDRDPADWDRALALLRGFDQDSGVADLRATLATARTLPGSNGRVGIVGYSLGGRLAFMMAQQAEAEVNVAYYGLHLENLLADVGRVGRGLVVHVAGRDVGFSADCRVRLGEATRDLPSIAIYDYPDAEHGFARLGGVHWQADSAALAHTRTVAALRAALD